MRVTRRGLEIPKGDARVDALVRRELTVSPVALNDPFPKKFRVFLETPTKFIVPTFWAKAHGLAAATDTRSPGEDCPHLEFKGSLRADLKQPEAVDAVLKSWNTCGGAMLCTVCGGGKTTMALHLVCAVKKKTMVVVHTTMLKDQWKERISQFVPAARVTEIQGAVCDTSGDIVVAMIQTLVSRAYPPSTFDTFGVVMADECFPYHQPVLTEHGPVRIGSIYGAWRAGETIRVHSFDETTRTFSLRRVTHAWEKRAERLVKVSYSKSCFTSTPNHRVLTTDGWKAAGELQPGDLLVSRYASGLTEQAVALAMNSDQYQVLLGSMLGDGHMANLPSGRFRLQITHGMKQRSYCEWKASMFGARVGEFVGGYANDTEVAFATRVIDLPRHKSFQSNKTHCPQWVLDEMDERALAIWHMDDGTLQQCGAIVLSTHTFDEDSHVRMCAKLHSMGLDAKYGRVTKPNGAQYFNIRLSADASRQMISMIARYVHPSMRYKIANARVEQYNYERTHFASTDNFSDFCSIPTTRTDGSVWKIKGSLYQWKDCSTCGLREFHNMTSDGKYSYPRCPSGLRKSSFPDLLDACSYAWNPQFLDYGTLRVSNVQECTKKDKRVYDLEVEGTHTFVCASIGGNGPVVHNCHHVAAPTLSQALFSLNAPRVLGLTATPQRKDGLSRVVEWLLDPIAFLARRTNQGGTHVRVVPYACADYDKPMPTNRRGDVCFVTTITRLVENPHRTHTIARVVAALVREEDRHVLVLSHRRQHCADIAAAVGALGVDAGTYVGGDKGAPNTRVIVATYALTSEGFDMPRLNALVLATPASDVEQSCGRVMRGTSTRTSSVAVGGCTPASAIIVDVVDQWGLCHAQHAKRRGFYKRSGFRMDSSSVANDSENAKPGDTSFAFVDDDS